MSALGSLVVKLALEHAEFTKGISQSDQAALKFAKSTQDKFDQVDRKTRQFFGNFAAGALGVVGSLAGVGSAITKFNSAIDTLADLSALSQRTGIAVETLSQLDRVIRDTGGSMEQTVASIDKLAQGMSRAAGPSNRVLNALDAIGVESKNLDGTLRDSGDVFVEVSKRLAEYEDGASKTALVMELFGRTGAQLLPVMNNVAARIDDTAQSSTEAALQAEAYNNAVGTLGRRFDDLFTGLSSQVLPTMLNVVEALSSSTTATDSFSKAGSVLNNVLKGLAVSGATIGGTFRLLGEQIGGRAAQLVALSNLDFTGASKIGDDLSKSMDRIKADVGSTIDTILGADVELVEAIERTSKKQLQFTAGAVDGTDRLAAAIKKSNEEAKKEVDTLEARGRALTLSLDPLARYNDEVAKLIELLSAGAISRDIFDKQLANEKKRYDEAINSVEKVNDKLEETQHTARRVFDDVSQFAMQGARNIQTALADALLDSTKGFKSFANNVLNIIKRMAAEVASVRILEGLGVDRLFGATGSGGGFGFSRRGGGGAGSGGGFNVGSLLSTGSNLLSTGFGLTSVVGGGLGALGSALGSGTLSAFAGGLSGGAAAGVSAGVLQGGMSAAAASGAANLGAMMGSMAGPLAIAFAVDQIGRLLAGNKSTGTIADSIPIIGGFAGALFGRGPLKQRESIIRGSVGAGGIGDDFLTSTRFRAKGGLARSNKNENVINSALTGELINGAPGLPESGIGRQLLPFAEQAGQQAVEIGKLFNETIGAFNSGLRSSAELLGIGTEALDNFNTWVQLTSEAGERITEQQIAETLADIGEQMAASLVPGLDALRKNGETAVQAVSRMAQEASALQGALVVLGVSANDAEQTIKDLSLSTKTDLIDAAGGLDAFNSKIGFFAENFLSAEEQLDIAFTSLDARMREIGFSADISVEEFKNLILSVTETGGVSSELANELLNLQGEFLNVKNSQEALANESRAAADEVDGLTDSINNLAAIQAERGGLRNRLLTLQGDQEKLRQFEILSVDESNRQLLGRIHALEDEKTAIEAVGDAVKGVALAVDVQKQALSDSLAQRASQSRTVIDSINLAIQAREEEKAAIRANFDAAIKANSDVVDNVAGTIKRLQDLSGLIHEAVKTIAPITKADAENQIIAAIARAKGGEFIDAAIIRDAVDRLTRQNENEFSSRLDMQRDAARSKNLLDELGGLTDAQLSTEEQALETLKTQADNLRAGFERQITQLDSMIEDGRRQIEIENQGMADLTAAVQLEMERLDSITKFAEDQYNELIGINTGIQSLAGAFGAFGATLKAANDAIVRTGGDSNVAPLPQQPAAPKPVSDQDIRAFFSTARTDKEIANAAIANNVSSSRIKKVMNFSQAQVDNFFRSNPDIPRFATGTSFVPETGPAIVHKGERIINPEQNRDLIQQLENLNKAMLQLLVNTGMSTRLFKRWDGDGLPPERSVA